MPLDILALQKANRALRRVGVPQMHGAIAFTWDDGPEVQYEIAKAAAARGQRHTFNVITGIIGDAGCLTGAQIAHMHAMGHEIASHGVTHEDITAMTTTERATHFDDSKTALEAILGREPSRRTPRRSAPATPLPISRYTAAISES